MIGLQSNGVVVAGNAIFQTVQLLQCAATVEMGRSQIRLQSNGVVVAGDRGIEVFQGL